MTEAEIIVLRRLHNGIYKSSGGGTTAVYSRHASGPRGLANAIMFHGQERASAFRYYGNIGAGAGWIEIVPKGGEPGTGIDLPSHVLWAYEQQRQIRSEGCIDCGRYHSRRECPNVDQWPLQPPVGATMEWWEGSLTTAYADPFVGG